jgi:hypothetical protein
MLVSFRDSFYMGFTTCDWFSALLYYVSSRCFSSQGGAVRVNADIGRPHAGREEKNVPVGGKVEFAAIGSCDIYMFDYHR